MAADLTEDETVKLQTVLQGIQRDINCLLDENRSTKKRALEKIKKEVLGRKPKLSSQVLQSVFKEVAKPLLKLFSDPVEKCRELSLQITTEFCSGVADSSVFLPYIIPTVAQRLGQPEITEPCEELRLSLVQLLTVLTEITKSKVGLYIDDLVRIMQRTVVDQFHEVKKESCHCTCSLAAVAPEQFYYQANSLVNPLLKSISHQHSRVRVACVQTIGVVIQGGDGKNVDDVLSHLAQRTFDDSPAVRMAITRVVGEWLLNLRDRYSYFYKLLPLLLSGLSDDMPDINKHSRQLMDQVGELFYKENENDLKDKMDFDTPCGYRLATDFARPNLGCRELVQRNISKILPAALRDMGDWSVDTRIKASSLVYHLLFYAEDHITQHMEVLLSGLYRGCHDEEERVVSQVVQCAKLAGSFVEPASFCKLTLPHLKTVASSSSSACASCLKILAALIAGCNPQLLAPHLKAICETLIEPDVCCSETQVCQQNLLSVVSAVVYKANQECIPFTFLLFCCVIHVLALQRDHSLQDQVDHTLHQLVALHDMKSVHELYERHTAGLLAKLKSSRQSWTQHSTELQLFRVLLSESGPVTGYHLDDIIPIFTSCFDNTKEPELKLKMFSLLSHLLRNAPKSVDSHGTFSSHALTVVNEMIIPNCVWKAGRTAAALRAAAISCLWALLQANLLSSQQASTVVKELLTQLTTCLEDYNQSTRLVSCHALQRLLVSCKDMFDGDLLHQIYPELLKRLDDSSDEIRVVVTKIFVAYFRAFPANYDCDLYKFHLQAMFKGLLVHLDDPGIDIQEAVLNALKEAAVLQPAVLKEQVEEVKHKHRVARYCEELLQHIRSVPAV